MALPLGQGRQARSVSWQTADQEGEQPLEASSHLVYETFGELSLADSPVKQELPQASAGSHSFHSFRAHDRDCGQGVPLGAASLPAPWAAHNLSPSYLPACSLQGPAEPSESPRVLATVSDASYELSMLRQRVQELEEQLAAAAAAAKEKERPDPSAAFATTMEQDLRSLQNRLRAREREAEAAQAALERGQAEAKNLTAQLLAERNKSAGLLDEVAQWRDEHAKAKKGLNALQKKLDAISAQNSLLEGSMSTLKRQNAELGKAAAEREAAMRAMQDRLQAAQGNEGSRHKQVQELVDRVDALHRENAILEQQLHEASAGACGAREQMQQLLRENASLRSEMQRMGDALAAARSQLWERTSREEASMAAGRGPMQHPASHLPGYAGGHGQAPAAARPLQFGRQSPVGSSWHEQPGCAAQLLQRGEDYQGSIPEESYSLGYGRQTSDGLEQPLPGCRPAEALHMPVQREQQWAPQSASMHMVHPEAAAARERYGEAAPAPAALRCLSFDAQAAGQPGLNGPNGWSGAAGQTPSGANAGVSPMLGPEGFNPRASLPQPYLPPPQHRSQTPERAPSPQGGQGGSGPWQQGQPPADYSSWQISAAPGLAGGLQACPRLSSSEDGSSEATPGLKARALAATPPPYGSEVTLQEMLARTQALESRLMKLSMEKNELEAEHARMPTNTAGRKLQDRRRKEEVASRLEVVSKEISSIRLQLKKLGYK